MEAALRPLVIIGAVGLGLLVSCGGRSSENQSALPATAPILFPAGDGPQGTQLWASDGTPQGTKLLKQINPQGWAFPNTLPATFTWFNGSYYFPAMDQEHGYELWRTDGTATGTALVLDAKPGAEGGLSYSPHQPFACAGGLFFQASWTRPMGVFLWRLDGNDGTTQCLLDGYSGDWGGSSFGHAQWGNDLVFQGATQNLGLALWRTNGTPAGTRLVASGLVPGSGLTIFGDRALSVGYKASGPEGEGAGLWSCDLETGFQELLIPMTDFVLPLSWNEEAGPRFNGGFALVEAKEGYNPDRFGLWRTDGTPGGTYRLMDLGSATGWMACSTAFQGKTYFAADDGVHGIELWATDGTVQGTRMVKDLVAGPGSSYPGLSAELFLPTGGFVEFKGRLYFGAGGPDWPNYVLWSTDGTAQGTTPLIKLPGTDPGAPKLPAAYCVVGDTLYFSAQTIGNAPYTRQLWRTDGTPEGTQRVTSFDTGQSWNPIWSIQPSPKP